MIIALGGKVDFGVSETAAIPLPKWKALRDNPRPPRCCILYGNGPEDQSLLPRSSKKDTGADIPNCPAGEAGSVCEAMVDGRNQRNHTGGAAPPAALEKQQNPAGMGQPVRCHSVQKEADQGSQKSPLA